MPVSIGSREASGPGHLTCRVPRDWWPGKEPSRCRRSIRPPRDETGLCRSCRSRTQSYPAATLASITNRVIMTILSLHFLTGGEWAGGAALARLEPSRSVAIVFSLTSASTTLVYRQPRVAGGTNIARRPASHPRGAQSQCLVSRSILPGIQANVLTAFEDGP